MKYAVRASRGCRTGSLAWSSLWMFRQASRSRSPGESGRTRTTPQHSAGYSASACARMRENSSALRIIQRDQPSAPPARATCPRRGRACPPGEGGDDRHFVAVLEWRLYALERLDRLAVHVDVDVLEHLALLIPHEP